MVMTADIGNATTSPRQTGSGIVVGKDRSRSFREARRHTILVKALRVVLPIATATLLGIYGLALFDEQRLTSALPAVPLPRITAADLAMLNPHYEGFTDDGGTYRVDAKSAQQDPKNVNMINIKTITGEMIDAAKSKTRLSASMGALNHKAQVLWLSGTVAVVSDQGLAANLSTAQIDIRGGIVRSKTPVKVSFPAGTITSNEMTLRQKAREITFVENVRASLKPPRDAASSASAQPPPAAASEKLFGASDTPVDITAARLDIKDADKLAIFTGNVRAIQAGSVIETPEMTVTYSGGAMPGGAKSAETAGQEAGGGVREIVAKGPVVMSRGAGERVVADDATFNAEQETAVLAGKVVMSAGPDRRASGDRATLDQKADTALLSGNVTVIQGANILRGRRLYIDRKSGQTELTSPPMDGNGPGRINVRLAQQQAVAGKKPAAKPVARDTGAQAGNLMAGSSFRADPSQPLDVEADSLDVRDTAKLALFRGGVVARQGGFVMKAETIKAHYTGSASLADVTQSSGAQDTPVTPKANGEPTALKRLEAKSNVEMVSNDGRKVTGDWATYDSVANTLLVGGKVEVMQGLNIIRGTRLTVDLTTGATTIDTSTAAAAAASATSNDGWVTRAGQDGVPDSAGKARPSAIFFPNQIKDASTGGTGASSGQRKPQQEKPGSGWSAETAPSGQAGGNPQ